jgi:hypothetical protein
MHVVEKVLYIGLIFVCFEAIFEGHAKGEVDMWEGEIIWHTYIVKEGPTRRNVHL